MARSGHCFGLMILSVALVGCGGSLTVTRFLDIEQLESTIADGITEQSGTGIQTGIQSVDCPEEVAMVAGNVFECTVTDQSGNTAVVMVTQERSIRRDQGQRQRRQLDRPDVRAQRTG